MSAELQDAVVLAEDLKFFGAPRLATENRFSPHRPARCSISGVTMEKSVIDKDENWSDENVVFRSVSAVAVYQNAEGEAVIRQESPLGEDDQVIVVPMDRLDALIIALQNLKS